uniref:Small ribosomal subunit protein uS4c n=1 Tax=Antrophyum semicostatum TaxID=1604141 RepID=A0A3G5CTP1_9MONI|nr:ribosomal protein S4 [Antrophyum semicostatum]AYW16249.1 ribosomal protein S4 [Antrophyum semicostatum]
MRRLRNLPGLAGKSTRPNLEEFQVAGDQLASKKISQFCLRLEAKQRLRLNYGLTERQLVKYVRIARKTKGSTGQVPLQLLEMRPDTIIFQLGIASTIPSARQLVSHRHILVNRRIVDRPSYRCKPGDIITIQNRRTSYNAARGESPPSDEVADHLTLSLSNMGQPTGLVNHMVNRESVGLDINELLVIEYYSRKA